MGGSRQESTNELTVDIIGRLWSCGLTCCQTSVMDDVGRSSQKLLVMCNESRSQLRLECESLRSHQPRRWCGERRVECHAFKYTASQVTMLEDEQERPVYFAVSSERRCLVIVYQNYGI